MARFGIGASDKEQKKGIKTDNANDRKARWRQRAKDRRYRKEGYDRGIGIVTVLLSLLLLASMFAILQGKEEFPTFLSFLDFLRSCPTLSLDFLALPLLETDTFIGEILIGLPIKVTNFVNFIVECLVNALVLLVWFFRWLLL